MTSRALKPECGVVSPPDQLHLTHAKPFAYLSLQREMLMYNMEPPGELCVCYSPLDHQG